MSGATDAANPSLTTAPQVDDWLSIDADGRVQVRSGKIDIGQRISIAVARIVAEELDVSPEQVSVAERRTGIVPNEGMTSGSNSIQHSGGALRLAAATARRHLLGLAAARLAVPEADLEVADGLVRARSTNRTVSYGDLLQGQLFGIAVALDAVTKPADGYRIVGQSAPAPGLDAIVSGRQRFVHDMTMPNMLHARVVRPPHYHATLRTLDPAVVARLRARGLDIVRDGSFLAVAGPDEHAVVRAASQLATTTLWDQANGLDEAPIGGRLVENPRTSLPVVDGTPRREAVPEPLPIASDAPVHLAHTYSRPYVMHGAIGPSAALALAEPDGLTVWTHSQGIYPLRQSAAEALGIAPESLTVVHVPGAGCYGHNGADDAAFDALLVARALPGKPVLLKWTRDDEHCWEPYTSAMRMAVSASLAPDGSIATWDAESFSDTHSQRPRPGPNRQGAGRLLAARYRADDPIHPPKPVPNMARHAGLHRNLDPYYALPRSRLVKNLVHDLPLRTSALRTLGGFANIFAIESMMDELAYASGQDPLAFRLRHLDDPRAVAVLEAAAAGISWQPSVTAPDVTGVGSGQGLGFARYTNAQAYAAVAVALDVDARGAVHLRRAVIAADAGEIIDPDSLALQMEGGFIQAASWALLEEVTWDRDGITSRDWEGYPILRFDNVPEVETILLPRPGDPPLGAGEASSGPAGAAIANAIHAATGLRLRHMPFRPEALRAAADAV